MTTIAAQAAPPAKKPSVSTLRRILWHVNRTDLGWLVKAALSAARFRELAERRRFVDQLPARADLRDRSQQLRENGYLDVTDIVSRSLTEVVAAHAEAKLARADELAGKQKLGHKSFWVSLLDEDLVNGAYPSDHPFVRYALQPEVLRILADYMGTLPQLSDVLLTLSRPMQDEKLSYSQLWHLDHDDKRVCKIFIYLTDVKATEDGPFTFMDAKFSSRFRNTRKSHLGDDAVFAKVGREAVREMIAPRLSSFIVDTARCLHMGSRIKSGHSRLLYTATFFPPPRIYPDPPARFYPRGEVSPLEQAVLAI